MKFKHLFLFIFCFSQSLYGTIAPPIDEKKTKSKLFLAITRSNLKSLARQLNLRIDLNFKSKDGNTPLHVAIMQDSPNNDVISVLLNHGANPNMPNKNKFTPFYYAVAENYTNIISIFLNNKNIKLQDDNPAKAHSPLFPAFDNENFNLIKKLAVIIAITFFSSGVFLLTPIGLTLRNYLTTIFTQNAKL